MKIYQASKESKVKFNGKLALIEMWHEQIKRINNQEFIRKKGFTTFYCYQYRLSSDVDDYHSEDNGLFWWNEVIGYDADGI